MPSLRVIVAFLCYDSGDGRFVGIVYYTAYANLKDCLAEGGRLPSD